MFFEKILHDPLQLYLYIAFVAFFIVQMIYYWGIFSLFAFLKNKNANQSEEVLPVSVVVCARNEFYNLEKNLPKILEQDYPDFEVVVVNDQSEDDTAELLMDLSRKYKRLKIITVQKNLNNFSGKKFSLSLGIKSAQHDVVLLTDADCEPVSSLWIKNMQMPFSNPRTKIVLGYGAYERRKGLLNSLIRFDTFTIALQYFSLARAGLPYMGVGRNLAYRRSLFLENKGFVSHYEISSGDDDLFVNSNATRKNTSIVYTGESHTLSQPKLKFNDWVFQKKRHFTTGKYYKFVHKVLLVLLPFSTLTFYLLAVILTLLNIKTYTIVIVSSFFIVRVTSQLIIFKKAMLKLKEKKLFLLSPFFEVIMIFFNVLTKLTNTGKKINTWK